MLSRHAASTSTAQKLLKTAHRPSVRSVLPSKLLRTASYRRFSTAEVPTQTNDLSSRHGSALGLRSQRPPDSLPESDPDTPPELPDQEWLIRTGRAIYVLQETLPAFFKTGLITSVNKITGAPGRPTSASTPMANVNFLEHHILDHDDEENIYSRDIRLSYTPPIELPAPFPKTFHIDGLQMYLASSSLIRHTMNALYSDLTVTNSKLVINTPSSPTRPPGGFTSATKDSRISREKSILLRQHVTGTARVSGATGEWEIESTYTFSPLTGLLHQHVVNSIRPAPHVAVYDYLRLSLGKLLRPEWGGGAGSPGAAFKGKIEGAAKSVSP